MGRQSALRSLLLITIACFGLGLGADAPKMPAWKGLAKMMSAEEFKAAGLDKLSPEELSRLNDWFVRFIAYDAAQVMKSDEKIQELQKAPLRHRIPGLFKGWSGETIFTLDNGEVWKQRLPGRYAVSLQNPEVEIAKNLFGFYELTVVQTGQTIGVSRLK